MIRLLGVTDCATFPTKAQAQAWATKREAEILAGHRGLPSKHTVADAIDRFIREVVPNRRGARWEEIRLLKFRRHKLALRPIGSLQANDMATWRDGRLKEVSPASVAREMNLWGALFSVAVREWRWLQVSPVRGVRRPVEPPARRRGISGDEIAEIIKHLNGPAGDQVKAAFKFSLETAMRAGEILSLTWDHVNLADRYVTLPRTKNGDSRQVPLSTAAANLLEELRRPGVKLTKAEPVFTLTGATLDVLFRRARDRAAIDLPPCATVRFHDARGEAITRLSRKLDVLELARVVGHRDINSLRFYYAKTAAEIAKKLD